MLVFYCCIINYHKFSACVLYWRLLEKNHFWAYLSCWQNLVPCGCKTEVSVLFSFSFLLVSWGFLLVQSGYTYVLAIWPPPYSKPAKKNLLHIKSLWLHFFNGSPDWVRSPWIICLFIHLTPTDLKLNHGSDILSYLQVLPMLRERELYIEYMALGRCWGIILDFCLPPYSLLINKSIPSLPGVITWMGAKSYQVYLCIY